MGMSIEAPADQLESTAEVRDARVSKASPNSWGGSGTNPESMTHMSDPAKDWHSMLPEGIANRSI
jgi:hypothetical protein